MTDARRPETDLSIVIVSYNVRHLLAQCLESVYRASTRLHVEIWVVDNASTDHSIGYLRERYPEVHYIANTENHGFSYANNQALRQCRGRHVLLLNPDTLVGEDVLEGCVRFLDSHPRVGATGVRMLNPNGSFAPESRRGLPTPFTSFCKMVGLQKLFPMSRTFGRYYMCYQDVEEANPIEIISGAFCMVRREALDKVGLLDESFFMYGEDIDFSYRLLLAGWQNYYLPLTILHYKGESTAHSSFRYVHVFYNAMLIFFRKHFSRRYRLLGRFICLAVRVRAAMDMMLRAVDRLRRRLHCMPRPKKVEYLSFDLDAQPISEMLLTLRRQPHGTRKTLETRSARLGVIIRPGEIIPYTPDEKKE